MKTIPTPTLAILLITLLGFLFFSSFKDEVIKNKFLTVKSIESSNILYDSHILVVDENGKASEVELPLFKLRNIEISTIKLTEVLNKIGSRGYELHSTTATAYTDFYVNTYTFIKK